MVRAPAPRPIITPRNARYWDALKRGAIEFPHCGSCKQIIWPISPICSNCYSTYVNWRMVSGNGRVNTWTIFHQSFHPAFEDLPYNVAEVQLDEGPRVITNLVGMGDKKIEHGMRVVPVFKEIDAELTLLLFTPWDR